MRTIDQLRRLLSKHSAPQRPFSRALKDEIRERQHHQCWCCGKPIDQICHIIHRGTGGDKRKNNVKNLIGLCREHHDKIDHRARPWLNIVAFDPSDHQDGFIIEIETDTGWERVDKTSLAFYWQYYD